jgi:hypothetical protein
VTQPVSINVNGHEWPVVINPDFEHLGYCYSYPPTIVLRRHDERVLLHEVLHAAIVMHPNVLAIAAMVGPAFQDAQEGLVRYLTATLFDAGYRLAQPQESKP